MSTRTLNLAVAAVATVLSCLALEIMTRIAYGMPVLTVRDWRVLNATILQGAAAYDPILGWVQAPEIEGTGFNTIAYGIRKNSEQD